jgi:hypothetical protein
MLLAITEGREKSGSEYVFAKRRSADSAPASADKRAERSNAHSDP